MPVDPVKLAQDLIRCPSVTGTDAGAQEVLEAALNGLGFTCTRVPFGTTVNLYARLGDTAPNFCFAGHTDVVPPGARAAWRHDPFAATIADGVLYGRGAVDMKGAIAAFVAAVDRYRAAADDRPGSISLLITGDEEGTAEDGTVRVLHWLKEKGERLDHCLVGEPTSAARPGDVIKIGRRGSMNIRVTVQGVQGHVAYPQNALNPIPILAELIGRLSTLTLDAGNLHFDPSTLAFTSVDVGNDTVNVIPAEARAAFNIRFNDRHTPDSLFRKIETIAEGTAREMGGEIALAKSVSGSAFLTEPGPYLDILRDAVAGVTKGAPHFSTSGGTSDARFIKDHCPVAELGLVNRTMHKADECVPVTDIEVLTRLYESVLSHYFANIRL